MISKLKFKKYKVIVPKIESIKRITLIVQDNYETYRFNALKMYNTIREQNGLKNLKRMPKGTTYTKIKG